MQSLDHQRSKYVWILKNRTHIDWGKWLAGESRPREPVVPLVYGLLAVKIVGGHRDRHKKVGGRFVYPVSQSRAHSRRDKLLGRSGVSTFSFTDDKGDEKTTHDPPRVNRILSSLYKKQRTSAHSRTHTPYFSLQSTPRLHISFFFSLLFLEPLHYFFTLLLARIQTTTFWFSFYLYLLMADFTQQQQQYIAHAYSAPLNGNMMYGNVMDPSIACRPSMYHQQQQFNFQFASGHIQPQHHQQARRLQLLQQQQAMYQQQRMCIHTWS